MASVPIKREIAFTIMDVARMLKTYADQHARQFGISRAQWAVLVRIDRTEGLKQSELAEILNLQPISLTRLLDRLAASGLIERRADLENQRVGAAARSGDIDKVDSDALAERQVQRHAHPGSGDHAGRAVFHALPLDVRGRDSAFDRSHVPARAPADAVFTGGILTGGADDTRSEA